MMNKLEEKRVEEIREDLDRYQPEGGNDPEVWDDREFLLSMVDDRQDILKRLASHVEELTERLAECTRVIDDVQAMGAELMWGEMSDARDDGNQVLEDYKKLKGENDD